IQSAVEGRPISAAWWALYCTLTDKLDGALAKALDARSEFGVQLDSLADLLAFGVAPATVVYTFYRAHPELGWASGGPGVSLRAIACVYVIAAAARLARFNVKAAADGPVAHYTGVPTTMTAGILGALFLACLKYSDPALIAPERLDQWRWLGAL